jgi:hypothetical protein
VETVKSEITSAVKSREEEIAESARILQGASADFVVKITGLAIEEVRSIADRLGLNKVNRPTPPCFSGSFQGAFPEAPFCGVSDPGCASGGSAFRPG